MSGIFPNSPDGGIPPNPSNAGNPTHAFPPTLQPLSTAALYYGNGCDVRLRPEVLNSLISEIAAITDRAELHYDPSRLINLQLATRYLIQRREPGFGMAEGGPDNYHTTLDPPATRYNNGMVLCLVPRQNNRGEVHLDVNGLGLQPVFRNDGEVLRSRDWLHDIPVLIGFYDGGAGGTGVAGWYHLGLVRSQVPLIKYGPLDVWVRTDGEDDPARDAEFNTADDAFKTIQFAWDQVAGRYAATPTFSINIRLGIPGTYDGADCSSFGGTLRIWGDKSNPDIYRVRIRQLVPGMGVCLGFSAINWVETNGLCMVIDRPFPPMACYGVNVSNGTTIIVSHCSFESSADNPIGAYMNARSRCTMYTEGPIRCRAANHSIGTVIATTESSQYMNAEGGIYTNLYCNDMYVGHGFWCYAGSVQDLSGHVIYNSNTTGPRWGVMANSIILANSQTLPGNVDGSSVHMGTFVP